MDLKIITREDVSALAPGQRYAAIPIDELFSAVAELLAKQATAGLSAGVSSRLVTAPIKATGTEVVVQSPIVAAHSAVGDVRVALVPDQMSPTDRMLAFVSDNPGCAAAFIISASKLPKPAADKLLLDLRKSKKLDTVGQKRGMRYYPVGVAKTS